MGTIVMSAFVTLDGVIQDPAGNEGFDRGGWFGRVGVEGREETDGILLDQALASEALLLGRRSYEFLAALWPSRTGALAERLNGLPKYVVSSTLADLDWENSTVLSGEAVSAVSELKRELHGEINLIASFQLGRALIELDLVDELRLTVVPVVLGDGERLFGETSERKPMRLAEARTVDGGVLYLTYARARDARSAG